MFRVIFNKYSFCINPFSTIPEVSMFYLLKKLIGNLKKKVMGTREGDIFTKKCVINKIWDFNNENRQLMGDQINQ